MGSGEATFAEASGSDGLAPISVIGIAAEVSGPAFLQAVRGIQLRIAQGG